VSAPENRPLALALAWAARRRPVLPLLPAGKAPDGRLVPHGLIEATTDLARIAAWWGASPQANVGLRCDGWLVLDVDGPEGEQSIARLAAQYLLRPTLVFPTPRGRRLAYGLPPGSTIGNGTTRLASPAGIHVRAGAKGYIAAPGSTHPSGAVYPPDNGAPVAPAPAALLRALEPLPPRPPAPRVPLKVATGDGTAYGLAALDTETRELAATPHGRRHDRLYLAACRLGELQAGGEVRPGVAEGALLAVLHGFEAPCDTRAGARTIEDGLEKGAQSPRSAPPTAARPRRPWPRVLRLGEAGRGAPTR
jgi:hypothetical protein